MRTIDWKCWALALALGSTGPACAEPVPFKADQEDRALEPGAGDSAASAGSGSGPTLSTSRLPGASGAEAQEKSGPSAQAVEDPGPDAGEGVGANSSEPALDGGVRQDAGGGSGTADITIGTCDFGREATACAELSCASCNPDQYNTYCGMACQTLIDCVKDNDCATADDPFCAERQGVSQTPNTCTGPFESGGGADGDPVIQAGLLLACVCNG